MRSGRRRLYRAGDGVDLLHRRVVVRPAVLGIWRKRILPIEAVSQALLPLRSWLHGVVGLQVR